MEEVEYRIVPPVPLGSSRPSYSRSRSRSRSRSPWRRLGLQIKISHLHLHLQLQLSLLCCLGNQPHVPLNLHILLLLRVVQHRTLAPVLLQQRCQLTRLHLDHLLIVVYNVLFSVLSLYPGCRSCIALFWSWASKPAATMACSLCRSCWVSWVSKSPCLAVACCCSSVIGPTM